jgi:hypothetical protein
MAKPLLARLPDVIDVTPVGVEVGVAPSADTNKASKSSS